MKRIESVKTFWKLVQVTFETTFGFLITYRTVCYENTLVVWREISTERFIELLLMWAIAFIEI